VAQVARALEPVAEIDSASAAYQSITESAEWVEYIVNEGAERARAGHPSQAIYGINTGFGIHAAGRPFFDPEQTRQLSRKLIMSHSTGVGEPLPVEVVRAAMLIRANTLAKGRSGARLALINLLLEMLNRRVTPLVPSMGSLGASGDLAPLAHLALVISRPPESMADEDPAPGISQTGGQAVIGQLLSDGSTSGQLVSGAEAMRWDGVDRRIVLRAKEGLALSNGATFSAALGTLATLDSENLVRNAEIAAALSLEALQGYRDAFLPQIHAARPHPGQAATAANILAMVEGSKLVDPGDSVTDPVAQPPQDAYSVRCSPQVIGSVRETLAEIRATLEREINSATDNPLIFVREGDGLLRSCKAISGGNFHGEPLAFAMDYLSIALTELGSISERRTFWLMDNKMSRGLPSMLVRGDDSYMNSGLMIAQYVAASLVSRCKTLSHPDSVDSIPSSANQEDHVSMSMNAALHAREVVGHITQVISIELLAAVTAIRHRLGGLRRSGDYHPVGVDVLGKGTRAAWQALSEVSPAVFEVPLTRDAVYYPYLGEIVGVVQSGRLVDAVRQARIGLKGVRSQVELTDD
jgi:histidine ammonia-lyase